MATDEAIEQRLGEDPEDESVKERLEREHGELLEELRALIPGAEVLFGFLLAIRFTGQFTDLNAVQRYVYYGTLVSTAVSLVMLLAPSAYHRLRFREGDKDVLVRKGNREAIAGTTAIALAFTGVLYLNKDEGKGKGQPAAKKLAELQRTVDELIGKGKIRPPATTQIQQAVAQLGQAVQQAG
jgi:hypothetical protein